MTFDPQQGRPQAEVTDEVDAAIADNEVVLFMKGSPMLPQCGYSDRAVSLIDAHREDFEAIDVLDSLEQYRTALAEHSGRETIPQTFVDGEFVGGSDILAQLQERGELADTLQA